MILNGSSHCEQILIRIPGFERRLWRHEPQNPVLMPIGSVGGLGLLILRQRCLPGCFFHLSDQQLHGGGLAEQA